MIEVIFLDSRILEGLGCSGVCAFCLLKAFPVSQILSGLLSNQGEKSINFYFIMVPLRKKYSSMVLQSPVNHYSLNPRRP